MILSPSLLSCDFATLETEIRLLEEAGICWLHLDSMDGAFVPNITFGPPVIASIRKKTGLFFDVHLMIQDPLRYIEAYAKAGADLLVIHLEADTHPMRTLEAIHSFGCKAGIALNPGTDINGLTWLLDSLDLILLMSVNPGFSGQSFIPSSVEKIAALARYLAAHGREDIAIQVDGGVSPENAALLVQKGAEVLVSGSSFFGHGSYLERHATFRAAMGDAHSLCDTWVHRS